MPLKPVMSRWNIAQGDIILTAPSIIDLPGFNVVMINNLLKIMPCKQVGNSLVEFPKGLILTVKTVEFSSYRDRLRFVVFKSKQTTVPVNDTVRFDLNCADFREVYFDKI